MGGKKADAKKNAITRLNTALDKQGSEAAKILKEMIKQRRADDLPSALEAVFNWLRKNPSVEKHDEIWAKALEVEEAHHVCCGVLS